MKIDKNFILREIADTWVVIPTATQTVDFNRLLHLSDSAAFLWRQMECEISREELLQKFIDEYDLSKEQAEADLEEFLNELKGHGVFR